VTSHVVDHALDREREIGSSRVAWAEMVLRDQEMPPDELRVVLTTADPEVIRRHLELHMERLVEWLITQRRIVARVERILAEAAERDRVATRPVTHRTVRPGISAFSVKRGSDQGEAERQ
jgi:hypothetical protein